MVVRGQVAGESSGLSRRKVLRAAGAAAGGMAVVGWSGVGVAAARPRAAVRGPAVSSYLYLAILTGGMIGKKGWPEFVPANFSVPAHAVVQAEIRCFDDGTATVPPAYSHVRGTVGGSMTVLAAVNGDIARAPAHVVKGINLKDVAHTLTVPSLGLNVPIPPSSTVRFLFATGAAGSHAWQCMSACGTTSSGWGGPMSSNGWMRGTMAVVGA